MRTDQKLEVLAVDYHRNGIDGLPFKVAIVYDSFYGDKKLVVMFEEKNATAVFSLDKLIAEVDIKSISNSWRGDIYDEALRKELWPKESEKNA
jgi:hypothetical protein